MLCTVGSVLICKINKKKSKPRKNKHNIFALCNKIKVKLNQLKEFVRCVSSSLRYMIELEFAYVALQAAEGETICIKF